MYYVLCNIKVNHTHHMRPSDLMLKASLSNAQEKASCVRDGLCVCMKVLVLFSPPHPLHYIHTDMKVRDMHTHTPHHMHTHTHTHMHTHTHTVAYICIRECPPHPPCSPVVFSSTTYTSPLSSSIPSQSQETWADPLAHRASNVS